MNLRLSALKSKSKRNKAMLYLHQCRQCGLLFERIGKAAAAAEFSWERKFMVDKCDTCRNFRSYAIC
jgi:hypothetical protein